MTLYCDGSGFNGKHCGFCVVRDGEAPHVEIREDNKTSNEMEYEAMLYALSICEPFEEIRSDSLLIVNQVTRLWHVSASNLRPLWVIAKGKATEKHADIHWIPREKNLAGFALDEAIKYHKMHGDD